MSAPDERAQQDSGAEREKRDEHGDESHQADPAQADTKESRRPETRAAFCGVCNENPGKYKCPRCRMPYCSVACNKTHRENHPPDPSPSPPKPTPTPQDSERPSPKPSPTNPFGALETSDKLQTLFAKYPRLQDQLLQIHDATKPPTSPSPNPFNPSDSRRIEKAMWDRATGLRRGKEALQRAREAEGEEGEGVREYQELVLHLLSGEGQAAAALGRRDEELLRGFVSAETGRSGE